MNFTNKIVCLLLFFMSSIQTTLVMAEPTKSVRLAIVNTPEYSGLLDEILPAFEKESGYSVEVYSGSDVYEKAKDGKADIVISHYGKHQVQDFVLEGYGSWPKIVFSNQAVIIGPKSDPANIKGLANASAALAKIAETNSKFIHNPIPGINYLTDILWNMAGKPNKEKWFIQESVVKAELARLAEKNNAYFIWGAAPFLKHQKKTDAELEIMVSADPLLQRAMSATLVNPEKLSNINSEGAKALQTFLLATETQAEIAKFRTAGSEHQLWWPAGRHN